MEVWPFLTVLSTHKHKELHTEMHNCENAAVVMPHNLHEVVNFLSTYNI